MPNQQNFRSDVTTPTNARFNASRIVRVPEEAILVEEIASSFAFDSEDNIELHFYTIPGNQLILSAVIGLNDDIIKSHVVSYTDNTYKNYIRIDFTKLFIDKKLILVPGDYRMVLNFFSDEIGSYFDRTLSLETISESRTEVQLVFNNTADEVDRQQNLNLLREFVEKSFNKTDAVGVAEKIFKSGVLAGQEIQAENNFTGEQIEGDVISGIFSEGVTGVFGEGVTADTIVDNIELESIGQTYENTIARIDRIDLRASFNEQLNNFLLELYTFIREEIVINGDERIQEEQYQEIIRTVVTNKIQMLREIVDNRIKIS
jgi:hypothetical protein